MPSLAYQRCQRLHDRPGHHGLNIMVRPELLFGAQFESAIRVYPPIILGMVLALVPAGDGDIHAATKGKLIIHHHHFLIRDELVNLFPNNINAQRLKNQFYLFSEFLQKFAKDYEFKPMNRQALVHGHCHHKSILKFDDEAALLKRLGLDFKILDSGCCGMAGSFGFEKEHYDISIKVGERVLIPAVKKAAEDTLIIANGFSCREQIRQTTQRDAHHLAQVVLMAIEESKKSPQAAESNLSMIK